MRNAAFLFMLCISVLTVSCNKNFATKDHLQKLTITPQNKAIYDEECDCNAPLHYAPSLRYPNHTPMKYIRMNFHFMDSSRGGLNMDKRRANWYVTELMSQCESNLKKNVKMWLPIRNNTPVLPTQYRYVLTGKPGNPADTGIYHHYDDKFCYFISSGKTKNNYDRAIFEMYGINDEFVLNAYFQINHPDSVRSSTYRVSDMGIGMGTSLKMAGIHEKKREPWDIKGIFNHEVGHCLGLRHSWSGNDKCEDTPHHMNCWNRNQGGKCRTEASNNMMDYNSIQKAMTPCQIGLIHKNFATIGTHQRKMLIANWCKLNPERHIYIRDNVHWKGAKDLEGHLTILPGAELRISCRTSIPKNGKITIEPGGKLVLDNCQLHNACGDKWKGIQIKKNRKHEGEILYLGYPTIENVVNVVEGFEGKEDE